MTTKKCFLSQTGSSSQGSFHMLGIQLMRAWLVCIRFSSRVPLCDSLRAAYGGCSLAWRLQAHRFRYFPALWRVFLRAVPADNACIALRCSLHPLDPLCDSLRAAYGGCSLAWRLQAHRFRYFPALWRVFLRLKKSIEKNAKRG